MEKSSFGNTVIKKIESNFTASLDYLTKTLTMKKFSFFPCHKDNTFSSPTQFFSYKN
jgi:hypothetical protein